MRAGDGCTRQVRVHLQTEDVREAWVSPQLDALGRSECTCGGCFRWFEMEYGVSVMDVVLFGLVVTSYENCVCLFVFVFFLLLLLFLFYFVFFG